MKIITIVGARPQFVKAAMLSRAILAHNEAGGSIDERILHTGQHYDSNMSDIFFFGLQIPAPRWRLTGTETLHGAMTGRMLSEIEGILIEEAPDYVLVYGDTNSTLAGALAAAKLHIPIVHVEAGLRSFNKQMPEEINRILTDHLSTLLCCPTFTALRNLANEGLQEGVHHVGDVMYDAALCFGEQAVRSSDILARLGLGQRSFRLCTLHRAENTDRPERLASIVSALCALASEDCPLVFPLHPRTRKCLLQHGLLSALERQPGMRLIEPAGFMDMLALEKQAMLILTDSGGIQKEAYFHRTPCITLREETEWGETVKAGWNQLAGWRTADILHCVEQQPEQHDISEYGSGQAATAIIRLL
jgi:UDP-GlcNAc3NAcA epimerase